MYGVYVVEQDGKTPFNRAMLMNVGAAEAVKQQVFIFLVLWFFFLSFGAAEKEFLLAERVPT